MAGGLGFGVISEPRPFGNNMLVHPFGRVFCDLSDFWFCASPSAPGDGRLDTIVTFANRDTRDAQVFLNHPPKASRLRILCDYPAPQPSQYSR